MSDAAPIMVKHAGEFIFSDWYDPPWPLKLIGLVAILWIVVGPVWVFLGVRRGRAMSAVLGYSTGAVLATLAIMAMVWGSPTWDNPIHRFEVLAQYLGGQLLLVAFFLAGAAAFIGWLIQRVVERLARP